MYAQVEKSKENKSRAVADNVAQKQISDKQGYRIVDNRPEAVVQRKLCNNLRNSSQIQHFNAFEKNVNHTSETQPAIQRIVIDPKRHGWSLDKFDRPDQIYIDMAGRLGYGDEMIKQMAVQFPNLHKTHVEPDDVQVDINIMVEQAVIGKIENPKSLNTLSAKRDVLKQAISAVSGILHAAKVDFVIQGSGAHMMLGATPYEAPGDIDIIVDNLALACKTLADSGCTETKGSFAVRKFVHNATKVNLDIVMGGEMSPMPKDIPREHIEGTRVLSPFEAICSLDQRMRMAGKRKKDVEGLVVLVVKNRYAFSSKQEIKVKEIVQYYLDESAVTKIFG